MAQYNVTYSPLYNIKGNTGYARQPGVETFPGDPAFNGSMFIALTDVSVDWVLTLRHGAYDLCPAVQPGRHAL